MTALALFDEPLCLQGKNFECKGLCALKSWLDAGVVPRFAPPRHSQMRFEACNSTAEKFYLPFPPLSYGKLRLGDSKYIVKTFISYYYNSYLNTFALNIKSLKRWALYQDRCLTGLPSKKVDTLRCDPRAHNTWRLVGAAQW